MTEKLVRLSDVEYYLRRTAKNMIDEAEKDAETLSDGERGQIGACVLALRELADNAHRLPAAAAAEVVRCKDCKHRGSSYKCPMRKLVMPFSGPGAYEDCTEDDGYCHMGAKMDGGAEDATD